jgi:hypothetical protein
VPTITIGTDYTNGISCCANGLSNETATKAHKWSYAALEISGRHMQRLKVKFLGSALLVKPEHNSATRPESDQKGTQRTELKHICF